MLGVKMRKIFNQAQFIMILMQVEKMGPNAPSYSNHVRSLVSNRRDTI